MDYFTIKQQFYTGNFDQVLKEIAKFNKTQDDTLVYYKNRSLIALGRFERGEEEGNLLASAFTVFYEFLQKGKDLNRLESAVDKTGRSPFALNLLVSALAISGDFDRALEVAVEGIDSEQAIGTPELLLTAVQVALLHGQATVAATMYENYHSLQEQTDEDEIILNFAESYINFNQGKQITGSNFYFYEELSQTFPSWKTQLGLLNLHLQQSHIPEAQEIIELLESDFYQEKDEASTYKPDLLANKITFIIQSGGHADELRSELRQLQPSHPLCIQTDANNATFDLSLIHI